MSNPPPRKLQVWELQCEAKRLIRRAADGAGQALGQASKTLGRGADAGERWGREEPTGDAQTHNLPVWVLASREAVSDAFVARLFDGLLALRKTQARGPQPTAEGAMRGLSRCCIAFVDGVLERLVDNKADRAERAAARDEALALIDRARAVVDACDAADAIETAAGLGLVESARARGGRA